MHNYVPINIITDFRVFLGFTESQEFLKLHAHTLETICTTDSYTDFYTIKGITAVVNLVWGLKDSSLPLSPRIECMVIRTHQGTIILPTSDISVATDFKYITI